MRKKKGPIHPTIETVGFNRYRYELISFCCASLLLGWPRSSNNESTGKRKSSRTRKGNEKLKSVLIEAARAASRTKNTYFKSQYHRIAARRGANRAAVAVAHSILTVIYHMLKKKLLTLSWDLTT